mgnify:CR=1 FL=1
MCAHKYIHPPNAKEMHYATIVWIFARHISAGDRQTDTRAHTNTYTDLARHISASDAARGRDFFPSFNLALCAAEKAVP